MRSALGTWLQLLRVPNLFTVPGDPLAGFLLATAFGIWDFDASVFLPIGASLCLYAAGLLLNDLMDLPEDARERPHRPLPRGGASVPAVWTGCILLFIAGLVLCLLAGGRPLIVGLAIVLCVCSYNLGLKRIPFLGDLNMGLCRGLSLLLGAVTVSPQHLPDAVVVAGVTLTLYVAAVAHLARDETTGRASLPAKWAPMLVLAASFWAFTAGHGGLTANWRLYSLLTLLLVAMTGASAARLTFIPRIALPAVIGWLIGALIIFQASLCARAEAGRFGIIAVFILLALWPLSRIAAWRFYAS